MERSKSLELHLTEAELETLITVVLGDCLRRCEGVCIADTVLRMAEHEP